MIRAWLRQPLLHFLLLGGAVFLVHGWLNEPRGAARRIVVSADEIERLRSEEVRESGVEPSRERLERRLAEWLEEEILYREALELGLDRDDVIIRRRLVQKMRFLSEGLARPEPPTEEELESFFAARREDYRRPARLTFTHVYLNPDHRADAAADAEALLAELAAAGAERAPERGDRFMLRHDYAGRTPEEIAALFGERFAAALAELAAGGWQGPVASSYGLHLVRVTAVEGARLPSLDEVREQVAADYVSWRLQREDERYRAALRDRYEIEVEWPEERGEPAAIAAGGPAAAGGGGP